MPSFRTVWPRVFQHAAARRRLTAKYDLPKPDFAVSTRSRPKAADYEVREVKADMGSFNTQPPEGG